MNAGAIQIHREGTDRDRVRWKNVWMLGDGAGEQALVNTHRWRWSTRSRRSASNIQEGPARRAPFACGIAGSGGREEIERSEDRVQALGWDARIVGWWTLSGKTR